MTLPGEAAVSVPLGAQGSDSAGARCLPRLLLGLSRFLLTRHSVGRAVVQRPISGLGACCVAAGAGAGLDALPAPGWRQYRGCPRAR